jgi:hypothetical protein
MLTGVPFSLAERRIRREARSATLRELALRLRRDGATYAAIGAVLGVSSTRARQIARKADRFVKSPHWHDGLPARVRHFLYHQGWNRLSEVEAARQVARLSRRELLRAPNIGHGAFTAIAGWLASHGLEPANGKGAPTRERPSVSNRPVTSGPQPRARPWIDPPIS